MSEEKHFEAISALMQIGMMILDDPSQPIVNCKKIIEDVLKSHGAEDPFADEE